MNGYPQTDFLLRRNLKDAGFGPKGTEEFLRLNGNVREQLVLLARQRLALLKKGHDNQPITTNVSPRQRKRSARASNRNSNQ